MAVPDLTGLSDDELTATIQLLGAQAAQLSIAADLVRDEQERRQTRTDPDKLATFDEFGTTSLVSAIAAAPAVAIQIAKDREAAVPVDVVPVAEPVIH